MRRPKMQSRPRTQPERPWTSEPGLFVDQRAHQPCASVNPAKSRPRERRQLRRLRPPRPVTQSSLASPNAPQDLQQISQSIARRRLDTGTSCPEVIAARAVVVVTVKRPAEWVSAP